MFPGLLPLSILLGTTLVAMLGIAVRRSHAVTAAITFAGMAAALISTCLLSDRPPVHLTMLLIDDAYSRLFTGLVIVLAASVVLLAYGYLEKHRERREEFYLLTLMATIGCAVLAASDHFVSFFLGIEILSVSLYAMIAYLRDESKSLEAGLKYLILAAASSTFLLFGMALIYADRGTLSFGGSGAIGPVALILLLVGVGFKLALAPFHFWTPDVYEGAPAPVTAFVATASKAAVFAALLRIVQASGGPGSREAVTALVIVAMASMLAGNLLALFQDNVKRILAYSSIAHLGYVLTALVAGGSQSGTAVVVYLIAYSVTTLGAFAVVTALSGAQGDAATLDQYRGLFWRRPAISVAFTAMLLSLAGIPATLGFTAKFFVLSAGAAVDAWALVIVLIVSSVVGLFYYLRVVLAVFATDAQTVSLTSRISPAAGIVVGAATVALIGFGIYPAPLLSLIHAVL